MKSPEAIRLRYDWWGARNRLAYQPTSHTFDALSRVLDVADYFIHRWADWAELAKMQPVHLLRHDAEDMIGRGLAWRWMHRPDLEPLCWPSERVLVASSSFHDTMYVYDLCPDGRVLPVVGERRRSILTSELDEAWAQDSVRRKAMAHA